MAGHKDSAAVYCGAIVQGDTREEIHATRDGLYARPQRRAQAQVAPWMTVERWRDVGEATLIANERDLVAVLIRVPETVRSGLLEAWRHVLRLRTERTEIVLGPSEWTVVEMPEASA